MTNFFLNMNGGPGSGLSKQLNVLGIMMHGYMTGGGHNAHSLTLTDMFSVHLVVLSRSRACDSCHNWSW